MNLSERQKRKINDDKLNHSSSILIIITLFNSLSDYEINHNLHVFADMHYF